MKILNATNVMKWVRVSEGKLPGVLALAAIGAGLATIIGVYGAGYKKALRDERKKIREAEKEREAQQVDKDGVINVDFAEDTHAAEEEIQITEEDRANCWNSFTNIVVHDHSLHAMVAGTIGLAYLAYKLKYDPIDNWGQLCYRTNRFNYESNERYFGGILNLLRKCADGASQYTASGNDEAVKALSIVAGDANSILNNVAKLRREDFGYRR